MSDQPKFTPGPWWIDKYAQVFTADGKPLLLTGVALTSGRHPQQEEAEANARLIAAAPDLYEACAAMLKTWGTDDEDAIVEARQTAFKAIAKAMGTEADTCSS